MPKRKALAVKKPKKPAWWEGTARQASKHKAGAGLTGSSLNTCRIALLGWRQLWNIKPIKSSDKFRAQGKRKAGCFFPFSCGPEQFTYEGMSGYYFVGDTKQIEVGEVPPHGQGLKAPNSGTEKDNNLPAYLERLLRELGEAPHTEDDINLDDLRLTVFGQYVRLLVKSKGEAVGYEDLRNAVFREWELGEPGVNERETNNGPVMEANPPTPATSTGEGAERVVCAASKGKRKRENADEATPPPVAGSVRRALFHTGQEEAPEITLSLPPNGSGADMFRSLADGSSKKPYVLARIDDVTECHVIPTNRLVEAFDFLLEETSHDERSLRKKRAPMRRFDAVGEDGDTGVEQATAVGDGDDSPRDGSHAGSDARPEEAGAVEAGSESRSEEAESSDEPSDQSRSRRSEKNRPYSKKNRETVTRKILDFKLDETWRDLSIGQCSKFGEMGYELLSKEVNEQNKETMATKQEEYLKHSNQFSLLVRMKFASYHKKWAREFPMDKYTRDLNRPVSELDCWHLLLGEDEFPSKALRDLNAEDIRAVKGLIQDLQPSNPEQIQAAKSVLIDEFKFCIGGAIRRGFD